MRFWIVICVRKLSHLTQELNVKASCADSAQLSNCRLKAGPYSNPRKWERKCKGRMSLQSVMLLIVLKRFIVRSAIWKVY